MPLAAWLGDHIADFANEVGHRDVTTSGAFEVMGAEVGIGLNQPTLPNLEPEPEPTARPDLRRVGDLESRNVEPTPDFEKDLPVGRLCRDRGERT